MREDMTDVVISDSNGITAAAIENGMSIDETMAITILVTINKAINENWPTETVAATLMNAMKLYRNLVIDSCLFSVDGSRQITDGGRAEGEI